MSLVALSQSCMLHSCFTLCIHRKYPEPVMPDAPPFLLCLFIRRNHRYYENVRLPMHHLLYSLFGCSANCKVVYTYHCTLLIAECIGPPTVGKHRQLSVLHPLAFVLELCPGFSSDTGIRSGHALRTPVHPPLFSRFLRCIGRRRACCSPRRIFHPLPFSS